VRFKGVFESQHDDWPVVTHTLRRHEPAPEQLPAPTRITHRHGAGAVLLH